MILIINWIDDIHIIPLMIVGTVSCHQFIMSGALKVANHIIHHVLSMNVLTNPYLIVV